MNVDLMELADCGSPERLVVSILKANPTLTPPVPVEDLAYAVGITDIERVAAERFEGSLVTNAEKSAGIIAVNQQSSHRRQRFTIAHEIGHFLMPTHTGDSRCESGDLGVFDKSNQAARKESEANRFAAGILLPAPLFRHDACAIREPDLSSIDALADRYQTSFEATANRFVEFCDVSCAFVFSQNGRFRYSRSTREFPWIDAQKNAPLPAGSLSAEDTTSSREAPTPWRELGGEVWFASKGKRLPMVYEQTMRLSGGFRVTMLQVELDADEEDDEGELEQSWSVRFPKR